MFLCPSFTLKFETFLPSLYATLDSVLGSSNKLSWNNTVKWHHTIDKCLPATIFIC